MVIRKDDQKKKPTTMKLFIDEISSDVSPQILDAFIRE